VVTPSFSAARALSPSSRAVSTSKASARKVKGAVMWTIMPVLVVAQDEARAD
jgi:hypothetical protein